MLLLLHKRTRKHTSVYPRNLYSGSAHWRMDSPTESSAALIPMVLCLKKSHKRSNGKILCGQCAERKKEFLWMDAISIDFCGQTWVMMQLRRRCLVIYFRLGLTKSHATDHHFAIFWSWTDVSYVDLRVWQYTRSARVRSLPPATFSSHNNVSIG